MTLWQVEIQVEIEELDDGAGGGEDLDLFELDPFDTVIGQDRESDSEDDDNDPSNDFDDFDDLSSDGEDLQDEVQDDDMPTSIHHIQGLVQKLDVILTLLFDHFRHTHKQLSDLDKPGEPPVSALELLPLPPFAPLTYLKSFSPLPSSPTLEPLDSPLQRPASPTPFVAPTPLSRTEAKRNLRRQFHTLLSIFDRTILRTFKSRYTQFLIFWYTSLDPEFSDTFQGMLVDTALSQANIPTVTRAAAASYIGSFISRANFVGQEGVRTIIRVLCEYLKSHLDSIDIIMLRGSRLEIDAALANADKNGVFYAVCQAVFLIFCFRWRDLDTDIHEHLPGDDRKPGKKWVQDLAVMQRVVNSVLNPLKVGLTTAPWPPSAKSLFIGVLQCCRQSVRPHSSRYRFPLLLCDTRLQQAL